MSTSSENPNPVAATRRYAASQLCDVVYGIQPMTSEMAEIIRTWRRDYGVDYGRLGLYLCDSALDTGASFGLGKALTELAAIHLRDYDRTWI
jgi:hypothetical protein